MPTKEDLSSVTTQLTTQLSLLPTPTHQRQISMSRTLHVNDVCLPQTVAPCDPRVRTTTMMSMNPRSLVARPLTRPTHHPEHSKRTSNTLHSRAPISGMPQARAPFIMGLRDQCHGARNAATRLQGLRRVGCTGKRHLRAPEQGIVEAWRGGAVA